MVSIARCFEVPATDLANLCTLPSTDEARPLHCPCCGAVQGKLGALNLVGHGCYQRQLLGTADAPDGVVIHVRRYRCLTCGRTTTVLPEEALPGHWYAGAAILFALVLSLLHGACAAEVRRRLGMRPDGGRWRSLERWTRQILNPLWGWKGKELAATGPARDREESRRRLHRLLAHLGVTEPYPPDQFDVVLRAAQSVVRGTAHSRGKSWPIGRTA